MGYLCIVLFFIVIVLIVLLFYQRRAIHLMIKQMEEIEKYPSRNRQLKCISMNRKMEGLLNRINEIYQARQQERITYQRRETQIRREIENISHDLRTPLTSIIGYVDLIQDKESKEAEREEYLHIIQERAMVLQGFIEDFYEVSRLEGENYPLVLDRILVQNALSETAVAYYREFEKRNILVEVMMDENPCFIIADKIQFNRILNNLIQNALKYAQSHFIIRQYVESNECVMQFENDKSQMKEEELERIFQRFYMGEEARNNKGTGLGLTIAKLLVEKMQGSIEAKLIEDTFVLVLRWKAR